MADQENQNVENQEVNQSTENQDGSTDQPIVSDEENLDGYVRDFDPNIVFHNVELGTAVNITLDDLSLKRMKEQQTTLLHLNYGEEDIDQKGLITYPSKEEIYAAIGNIAADDGKFKRPKIISPTNKDKDWRGKLEATPWDDFGNGIDHIKTVWTVWSSLGTTTIEITPEVAELTGRPMNEAFISTGMFRGEYVNIRVDYYGSDGTRLAGIPVRVMVFPISVVVDDQPNIKYYSDKEEMTLEIDFNRDTMFSCNIEECTHHRSRFSLIKKNAPDYIHQMLESDGVDNIIDYHPLLKDGEDEYDNLNSNFRARPLDKYGISFTGFGELEPDTDYLIMVAVSTMLEGEELWGNERIFTFNISRGVLVPAPRFQFPTPNTLEIDFYGCFRVEPLKIINNSIHLGTVVQVATDENFKNIVFTKMGSKFGERMNLGGDFTKYEGNPLAKRYKDKLNKDYAEGVFIYPLDFEDWAGKVVYIRAKSILTNFTEDRTNKPLVTTYAEKAWSENLTQGEFLEFEPIESDWSAPVVFSLAEVKAHTPKLRFYNRDDSVFESHVVKSCEPHGSSDSKYVFYYDTDGWGYYNEEGEFVDDYPTYPLTDYKVRLVLVQRPLKYQEHVKRKNNEELIEWFKEQKYISPVEPNLYSILSSEDNYLFNGNYDYDVETEYLKVSNFDLIIKKSYTGVRGYLLMIFNRMGKELKMTVNPLTFVSQEYVRDNLTMTFVDLVNGGSGSNGPRRQLMDRNIPDTNLLKQLTPVARVKTNLLGEEARLEELAKRPGAIPMAHTHGHWKLFAVPKGVTDVSQGTLMWEQRSRFNKFVLGGTLDLMYDREDLPDFKTPDTTDDGDVEIPEPSNTLVVPPPTETQFTNFAEEDNENVLTNFKRTFLDNSSINYGRIVLGDKILTPVFLMHCNIASGDSSPFLFVGRNTGYIAFSLSSYGPNVNSGSVEISIFKDSRWHQYKITDINTDPNMIYVNQKIQINDKRFDIIDTERTYNNSRLYWGMYGCSSSGLRDLQLGSSDNSYRDSKPLGCHDLSNTSGGTVGPDGHKWLYREYNSKTVQVYHGCITLSTGIFENRTYPLDGWPYYQMKNTVDRDKTAILKGGRIGNFVGTLPPMCHDGNSNYKVIVLYTTTDIPDDDYKRIS